MCHSLGPVKLVETVKFPLVIPGKVYRITTCVAISADLFFVEMMGTQHVISCEVQHVNIFSPFLFLTLTRNQCLPSSLCGELFYLTHITSALKGEICSFWSHLIYTPQYCSSAPWWFESVKWTIGITFFGTLLSFHVCKKPKMQGITAT